jgi:hypothetical protein
MTTQSTLNGTAAQITTAKTIIAERLAEFDAYDAAPEPTMGIKRKPTVAAFAQAPKAELELVREWLASLTNSAWIISRLGRHPQGFDIFMAYRAWKLSRG